MRERQGGFISIVQLNYKVLHSALPKKVFKTESMKNNNQTYLEILVSELWTDHCSAPMLRRVAGGGVVSTLVSVGPRLCAFSQVPASSVWGTG